MRPRKAVMAAARPRPDRGAASVATVGAVPPMSGAATNYFPLPHAVMRAKNCNICSSGLHFFDISRARLGEGKRTPPAGAPADADGQILSGRSDRRHRNGPDQPSSFPLRQAGRSREAIDRNAAPGHVAGADRGTQTASVMQRFGRRSASRRGASSGGALLPGSGSEAVRPGVPVAT
jgi:hypothetical protein